MKIEIQQRKDNIRFRDIAIGALFSTPTSSDVMMKTEETGEGYNCVNMSNGLLDRVFSSNDGITALEQVGLLTVREI